MEGNKKQNEERQERLGKEARKNIERSKMED